MKDLEDLFTVLNERFDHIYVISLKRSIERQARFKELLRGLNYEIFWAVDGSMLDLNQIKGERTYDSELAMKMDPLGCELVPDEIGCALSHLGIYKDILAKNYRNALILEDDITVDADTTSDLVEALAQLPDDWELLYLGYLNNNSAMSIPVYFRVLFAFPILSAMGFKKYNAKRMRRRYPRKFSKNLDLAGSHYGAHAYAVTAAGAKKILTRQSPVSMAADNVISMMCVESSIKALRIKKRVFHQNRELPTTIRDRYQARSLESNKQTENANA